MKVSAVVAQILKREGVEFVIGYPVNHIIESAAEVDIRTIIVRQERIGLHMADAVSRVTSGRKIGIFAMQMGPGAENAFGGVAQAYADSVPIIVFPGGYDRAVATIPPNFSAFASYRLITKWIEQINLPSETGNAIRRAFSQARNGRPRPVAVEIPWDVMDEEIDWSPDSHVSPARVRSAPDPSGVRDAARMLADAKRPVIYAGQGVHYAEAWPQLRELAELLGAPVTTSLQGKSAFPEDHPLSLGSGGRAIPKAVRYFLDRSDVILGIGASFGATGYGVAMPKRKKIIHATLDGNDLNVNVPVTLGLVGDAALTLEALIAELRDIGVKGRDRGSVEREVASVRDSWLAEWLPKLTSDETPMTPYRVIWDLLHTVDVANTIITHDAGSPRDQLSPFWQATSPLGYIGWGKSTQLGYGLGLAMGAKLARPDKLCINVMGDAAIGFTGMDFETAVRERIPHLTIVLNNFSMAIELDVMPVSGAKFGSTDISGDYAAMARAFGGYGERVTDPSEIKAAIRRAVAATEAGQPALLEFITSKEQAFSLYPVGSTD